MRSSHCGCSVDWHSQINVNQNVLRYLTGCFHHFPAIALLLHLLVGDKCERREKESAFHNAFAWWLCLGNYFVIIRLQSVVIFSLSEIFFNVTNVLRLNKKDTVLIYNLKFHNAFVHLRHAGWQNKGKVAGPVLNTLTKAGSCCLCCVLCLFKIWLILQCRTTILDPRWRLSVRL